MPSTRAAAKSARPIAVAVAIFAVALAVAAAIKRAPPDFASLPPIATVRDAAQLPLWTLRLAPAAHQIAVDGVGAAPPPAGRAYQLWLAGKDGPQSLGLLPDAGHKIIAETPGLIGRLAAGGQVLVTLEPARGSDTPQPNGPVVFRAAVLAGKG
ncbi:MAG TPA: anti-sigma factor [Stellaceae bacterium]|jgi:anti-sigma-K factor RskA|nr:anti-sigma factor [Stellaceae bacterium]